MVSEEEGDYDDFPVRGGGPHSIIWLLTGRCNLRCRFCYVAGRFSGASELSPEEAAKVLDEALAIGVEYLGFTGGEVFLRPDAVELMRKARARGVQTTAVTNGLLLSDELAERLASYGVKIFLSVDGATKQTHEQVRGPGTWEKVLAAAYRLRVFGVRFSTVLAVSKLNFREAAQYLSLARELGAASACLVPVMPQGRAQRAVVLNAEEFLGMLQEVRDVAEKLEFNVELWCVPFAGAVVYSPRVTYFTCRDPGILDISPSGDALACDVVDVAAGNVREGLSVAWKKLLQSEPARSLLFPKQLPPPCRNCPAWVECRGGCFARALLLAGDIFAADPLCPRAAGLVS